ncbi:hypothetical protein [Salinibacterium sp. ZJ450]|uniref:hypothetical protein n=1 Tax=Salinibacterium sp. ZJ450 TaxID=2708338 RepID=UPI001423734E|nr:hypothetical protein [Salinibacterium sp. ZJ450]
MTAFEGQPRDDQTSRQPAILFRTGDSKLAPVRSWFHFKFLIETTLSRLVLIRVVSDTECRIAVVTLNRSLTLELALRREGGYCPVSRTEQTRDGAVDQLANFLLGHLPSGPDSFGEEWEDQPGPASGRVVVRTVSGSEYLVDLDRMTLCRSRANTLQSHGAGVQSVRLRRDGELIKILTVVSLQVGFPAVFVLEPLGNPRYVIFTRRTTTTVLSIRASDQPIGTCDGGLKGI